MAQKAQNSENTQKAQRTHKKWEDGNAAITLLEKWTEKIQALNRTRTHDLFGAMLYQLSYQSHIRAVVSGFGPLCLMNVILGLI